MLTLALRVLRAPALAEDTLQEVLLRLWSRPERFNAGRGSLRAFLLATSTAAAST
jgi:RNA polymerase sigma-70 factor (ECF subfamily)